MKKYVSILGSTGSVGLNTLSIIDKKKNYFKPFIFSANKNYKLISKQIKKYKPVYFLVNDNKTYLKVLNNFKISKVKIINTYDEIKSAPSRCLTISAIPGIAGLIPILELTKYSDKILLANKEAIICGWNLIKKKAKLNKTKLIPVDSEHYSILQLIKNEKKNMIKKIYLTASGGPFLNFSFKKLKRVTPSEALNHPKWKMGKKISIDSATLMNKIFEVVEAKKIFNLPSDKLDIIIHPNSLVHAILELKNGLKKFIYHETSMKIPLANAIFNGGVDINYFYKKKKLNNFEDLIFKEVNKKNFPAIKLKDIINRFDSAPIIVNAVNEVLVEQFLAKNIRFLDINRIISSIMRDRNFKKYAVKKPQNINQINFIDMWARKLTLKKLKK